MSEFSQAAPLNPSRLSQNLTAGGTVLLVFVIVFVCYGNTLSAGFVQDDHIVILQDLSLRSLSQAYKIFSLPYWGNAENGAYRPLTSLSFALNYAIGGLNPFGYHLGNLLLHALNCCLIGLIVWKYRPKWMTALVTMLLFAIHPIHTEAVSQLVGRTELLSTFLMLVAWLAWLSAQRHRSAYILSLGCSLSALFVKESAIVFIGVLVLSEGCAAGRQWRTQLRSHLPQLAGFFMVACGYLVVRVLVLKQFGASLNYTMFRDAPLTTRLFTMNLGFVRYFELLVWPTRFCSDYDFSVIPLQTTLSVKVLLSAVCVLGVLATGIGLLWRNRLCAGAILFFFVTISIVSNIALPTGILIAERVLYFPSIGVCVLAAYGLERLSTQGSAAKAMAWSGLTMLVLLGGWQTWQRNFAWKDDRAWILALTMDAPNNPKGVMALAALRAQEGNPGEAEKLFRHAIELAPDRGSPYEALGNFYLSQARPAEARPLFEKALRIQPRLTSAHIGLGRVFARTGNLQQAVSEYQIGLSGKSPKANELAEYGVLLSQTGNLDGALEAFTRSLSLQPEVAETQSNLGLVLKKLGRIDEALVHLRQAVRLEPDNPTGYVTLGTTLLSARQPAAAAETFAKAISLKPDFAEAHNNLGVAFMQLNQPENARHEFETALHLNPQSESAQRNLEKLQPKPKG
ncbi:MAG: tetratricopeptide repeat protein [Blastocatellia bacterium]|nr:tetratricopeptide repeat protein [Blastocatellia bacterium]